MSSMIPKIRSFEWRYPTLVFLAYRILLSTLGLALFLLGIVPTTEDPVFRPYFGVAPVTQGLAGGLLGVWQRFDAIHFLRIAQSGYAEPDLSPFFPLYPFVIRVFSPFVGGDILLAALLVSNLACLLALVVGYNWLRNELADDPTAQRTILYLVLFPTSFFLFAPYSESLFLLLVVLSLETMQRRRWLQAGAYASLATVTRIGGIMLSAAILTAWIAERKGRSTSENLKALLAACMPVLAAGGLALWRAVQGLPGMVEVQSVYWHRVPSLPWEGVVQTVIRIVQRMAMPIEFIDLAVVLGMVLCGLLMLKRLPTSMVVFHWSLLLLNLSQIRIGQPLSGQARFSVTLLPAFLLLAQFAAGPRERRLVIYGFFALNVFLSGQYVLWGWVG